MEVGVMLYIKPIRDSSKQWEMIMHYAARGCTSFFTIAALTLLIPLAASSAEGTWPQFRGPNAIPFAEDNPDLPETWSTTENVAWVTDIPGLGWSGPVVWGNKVFLTTVGATGDFERPRDGLYLPFGRKTPPDVEHSWYVYCIELDSGEVLWRRLVNKEKPRFPRHPKNTYASETPATDGERVYVLFGDLMLLALDMEGNEVWRQPIEYKKNKYDYGAAASPIVHDGQVIMVYDNEEASYIASFDAETGKQNWRTEREEISSWATPYVWENELRTEIVTNGKNRVRSYDLSGKLLWEFDGRMSWAVIAQPFSSHGLLYVNSGYFGDKHRPVYAVRPGASGDISLHENETHNEFIAWYQPAAGNYNTSPLVYGDFYYSLLDLGFLECYDALTGEQEYGRQKISPKRRASFTASPWAYNGKIFCLSEQGETFVIEAGPEFKVLHQNSLEEMCMSSPAILDDSIIIRTISKLYRIKK